MKLRFRRPLALLLTIVMVLGLLPTTALAAPGNELRAGSGVTSATINIEGQDYDLLGTELIPLSIRATGTFSITVTQMDSTATNRQLTVSLGKGLQWVSIPEGSSNWTVTKNDDGDKITEGYVDLPSGGYDCENGSITYNFSDTSSSYTVSATVRADPVFYQNRETTLSDVLTISYSDSKTNEQTSNAMFKITGDGLTWYTTNTIYSTAGTVDVSIMVNGQGDSSFRPATLFTGFSTTVEVPMGASVSEANLEGKNLTISEGVTSGKTTTYELSLPKDSAFYFSQRICELTVSISFPVTSESSFTYGTTQTVTFGNISVQYEGMSESYTAQITKACSVQLIDPNLSSFQMNDSSARLFDWDGSTSYRTRLSVVLLRNMSTGEGGAEGPFTYTMDASVATNLLIDRVTIPCNAKSGETYLPTAITVTGSNNQSYQVSVDTIKALQRGNYGVVLDASTAGLPDGVTIQTVTATIPKFQSAYMSTHDYNSFNLNFDTDNFPGCAVYGCVKSNEDISESETISYSLKKSEEVLASSTGTVNTSEDTQYSAVLFVDTGIVHTATAGDTIDLSFTTIESGSSLYNIVLQAPEVYLFIPKGMSVDTSTIKLTSGSTPVPFTITTVTDLEKLPEGWTCLKLSTAENTVVGKFSSDYNRHGLTISYQLQLSNTVESASYLISQLLQLRSSMNDMIFTRGSSDLYGINGGNVVAGPTTDTLNVIAKSEMALSTGIKMEDEESYYYYDPQKPNTKAVFTPGEKGTLKVTLYNGSSADAENVQIFVPIPVDDDNIDTVFQDEAYEFTMTPGTVTAPEGWTVKYGKVNAGDYSYSNVPETSSFADTYSSGNNMILLTCDKLAQGASAEFTIDYTGPDTAADDFENIFKVWYYYESGQNAEGETIKNAPESGTPVCALLQAGTVSGTVFVDADRDGTIDQGEARANATVEITDQAGRTYRAVTGTDGTYTVQGLPCSTPVTVTVYNPASSDPQVTGALRFAATGSNVSVKDGDQNKAVSEAITLNQSSGAATINAALVEPYTVTFAVKDSHGHVNPASVKAFDSQTLNEVLQNAPTVTMDSGWKFSNTWLKGSETDTINHSDLLSQAISGDVTYTAQVMQAIAVTISGTTDITLQTPTETVKNTTTLTATVTNTEGVSNVTYQWQKLNGLTWEDLDGKTESTLTLDELKIGDNATQYRCVVSGGENNSAESNTLQLNVKKGEQAAPNVSATQPSTIGGTGSIGTGDNKLTTTMQYNTNGGTVYTTVTEEQASSGITGIRANTTYYIRYAETDYLNASPVQTVTIGEYNPSKEPTPTGTFEASDMTLSGLVSGQKYKIGEDGTWTDITGTSVDLSNAGLTAGSVIYIYKPGNGTTTINSDEQTITLTQAAKPSGTATNETSYQGNNGTITISGYNSSYTYQISSDNGTTWTDATVDEQGVISNLAPGDYVIRVKGQGTMLTSEPSDSLTVNPYVQSSEAKITSFKVTVNRTEYTGTIDQDTGAISVTLPAGTDPSVLNSLTPSVEHTGEIISPDNTAQNFSSGGVTYTVTAEDGTTKTYTAAITIAQPDTYTITVTDLEHGTITTTPSGSAAENAEVSLSIKPDTGYKLTDDSLKVTYQDGEEQTVAVTDNKFTMPAHDVTVSAEFEAIRYTISYDLNGGTNAAGNPTSYTVEDSITLQAPSRDGFTFTGWTWNDQTEPTTTVSILAGNITGNLTFVANWQEDTPTPPEKHTVTVNGSYADSSGAGSYAENATVTIQAGSRENYTFTGWTVTAGNVNLTDTSSPTTTFTMPAENVTVTATWRENEPVPAGSITATPADIIIYMGGNSGYDGAVNDEGEIVVSSSLPEPGFVFDLPDELESALATAGADITDVTFQNRDNSKTWKVQLYPGLDENARNKLYTIVPDYANPDAVRVVFTDGDKHIVSDEFTVGKEINKEFGMSLYTGPDETIKAAYGDEEYPVELGEGTLKVLGTTGEVSITTVTDTAPTNGQPGAVETTGTAYTVNDSEIEVTGGNVSLLFDSIINHIGNDRTRKLEERAAAWLAQQGMAPATEHQFVYELKYLDLVDADNGNTWVTASQDLTIYWPLPDGADANSLKVLHFKGLHRDMTTGEIETEISSCDVESLTFDVKGDYVTFKVGSGGFSPSALVWQEDVPANTHTITSTTGMGGSISPSGSVYVTDGTNQTFTFYPNTNYAVSSVTVDGTPVSWSGNSYTFTNVTAPHTIEVAFVYTGSTNPGPGGDDNDYTLYYHSNFGTDKSFYQSSASSRMRVRDYGDMSRLPEREGYLFVCWNTEKDGSGEDYAPGDTFRMERYTDHLYAQWEKEENIPGVADPDDTGVSGWLNTTDHRAFLNGYTDGRFGPDRNMTRAEVAQMFYNLLLNKDVPITVSFTDVSAQAWYAEAVNTLASLGIVQGIGNSLYAPDRPITRAEFTAIAMRFANLDTSGENIFSDVSENAWYYDAVVGSIQYGWINGYEDGTFRPNKTITRAEVTTITNRMLGRAADEQFVNGHVDELRQFPDVSKTYWAYYQIMEATNAHDYIRENGTEDWTRLS